MLCCSGLPESTDGWQLQVKFDGIRGQLRTGRSGWTLRSRPGHDRTAAFPELAALRDAPSARPVLLDGQVSGRRPYSPVAGLSRPSWPFRLLRRMTCTRRTRARSSAARVATKPKWLAIHGLRLSHIAKRGHRTERGAPRRRGRRVGPRPTSRTRDRRGQRRSVRRSRRPGPCTAASPAAGNRETCGPAASPHGAQPWAPRDGRLASPPHMHCVVLTG
jgi:hypothetical protein